MRTRRRGCCSRSWIRRPCRGSDLEYVVSSSQSAPPIHIDGDSSQASDRLFGDGAWILPDDDVHGAGGGEQPGESAVRGLWLDDRDAADQLALEPGDAAAIIAASGAAGAGGGGGNDNRGL